MVDLNKEEQEQPEAISLSSGDKIRMVLSVATVILAIFAIVIGFKTTEMNRETERLIAQTEEQMEILRQQMNDLMCADFDGDGFCGTSNSGPEQQPVQEDGDFGYPTPPVMSPSLHIVAPTPEYPFGGYEGYAVAIVVPAGGRGTVWTEFDHIVRSDAPSALDTPEREELVLNLTRKLEEQQERSLDLVQPGEKFVLDLSYEPSRNGTPVPSGENAPTGNMEESYDSQPSSEFDPEDNHANDAPQVMPMCSPDEDPDEDEFCIPFN